MLLFSIVVMVAGTMAAALTWKQDNRIITMLFTSIQIQLNSLFGGRCTAFPGEMVPCATR